MGKRLDPPLFFPNWGSDPGAVPRPSIVSAFRGGVSGTTGPGGKESRLWWRSWSIRCFPIFQHYRIQAQPTDIIAVQSAHMCLAAFFAQSLLDRSTISYHGESTATRCPRQGAFERRHKKKRDEGSWREPSSLFFLCRLSCFSQKCPALGSQMHRLHPDMLVFGAVWEVRQEAEGCIPKFLECYKPQAKEILLDYLHQASSMDHDQIDHLLRQNRDWWRLNCGEILQKKLPVSTCESSRTTLFSPLRTSSNGARCSTSASMLTP